jgi:HEAT repeat protein
VGGALAALGEATVPGLADDVASHVTDKDLGVRVAACHALGRVAAKESPSWKGLRKGLDDRDASVRAACADAISSVVAHGGGSNKTAYWRLIELLKDRDDHVRAAAVTAAASLQPSKIAEELAPLSKEKSPTVLAALAGVYGRLSGTEDPPKKLVALAGDASAAVRLAAVTALAKRGGKSAAVAAKAVVDPDRAVRIAAIAAVTDPDALATLSSDADADVAAAAAEARVLRLGRQGTLAAFLAVIEGSPTGSSARVRAAAAWLQAR